MASAWLASTRAVHDSNAITTTQLATEINPIDIICTSARQLLFHTATQSLSCVHNCCSCTSNHTIAAITRISSRMDRTARPRRGEGGMGMLFFVSMPRQCLKVIRRWTKSVKWAKSPKQTPGPRRTNGQTQTHTHTRQNLYILNDAANYLHPWQQRR